MWFALEASSNTCVQYCMCNATFVCIYYSHLASQDLDINLKLNRMSQDSLVSALPSNGWSCETLEYGIREAARMSGIELKPGQLSEAGKYREVGRNRHICYAGCSLIYFFFAIMPVYMIVDIFPSILISCIYLCSQVVPLR